MISESLRNALSKMTFKSHFSFFLCQKYDFDFGGKTLSIHQSLPVKKHRIRKIYTLELDFFNENNVQHQEYYEHLKSQF